MLFLSFLLAACFVGLPGCGEDAATVSDDPPPHVLLITLDTTRGDHMGWIGHRVEGRSPTPNLDAFARTAWPFEETYASVPLTLPSHATILTGLEPPAHGLRENDGFILPPREEREFSTLAERLKEKGYRTAAFVSAQPLARVFGLDQGFDHYDDELKRADGQAHAFRERDARAVTERALGWLDEHLKSGPTFVWVHYFDPHHPFVRHTGGLAGKLAALGHPYDAEIAHMDEQIGELFARYEAAQALDDAIVVVIGDHGEALGEHGETTHGLLLHDATLAVPGIVRMPRARRPSRIRLRTADITPTILDGLGLPVSDGTGASILGDGNVRPPAYAETMYPFRQYGFAALTSWRDGDLKLVHAGGDRHRLFDTRVDPRELKDIAAERADDVSRLSRSLRSWRQRQSLALAKDPRVKRIDVLKSASYIGGPAGDVPMEPSADENARRRPPSERLVVVRLLDELRLALGRAGPFGAGRVRATHLEEARQRAQRLLDIAPDCPAALFWSARAFLEFAREDTGLSKQARSGLLDRSVETFDRLLAHRPLDYRARNLELLARWIQFELLKKKAPLDDLVRRAQDQVGRGLADGLTHAFQGRAFEARGDLEPALEAFERAVRLAPERETYRLDRDRVRRALGGRKS